MSTLTDSSIKVLLAVGLTVQVAAVALGFTSAGWRWPISAATGIVAAGLLAVMLACSPPNDGLSRGIFAAAALALAAGIAHASTPAPAAAWLARIAFGVEALFQVLLVLFFLFFKLNRLW